MDRRIAIGAVLGLSVLAAASARAEFPERDLQGVIMWGAGGATDVVARAVTPHVEKELGKQIVLTNRAGGAGAISTAFVNNAPSDGYTILYGAENPQLHGILRLSNLDYRDFHPVNVLARGIAVVVTRPDAPWKTVTELSKDAQARPGVIKMGSTGPGGLPHVVGALLNSVAKFKVTSVPFDGEGPGLTALQGGHVDFMPVGLGAAAEHLKAGRLRALAVINAEPVPSLPGVPAITQELPAMGKYLPWGPFYGIWVKKDVPDAAKAKLADAFSKGASNEQFRQLMDDRGNVMMNVSGKEAQDFLDKWQSVTAWVLFDNEAAKRSPEELNIPRP